MSGQGAVLARGISDGYDALIAADEPLAGLQRRCGGDLPGTIAIPTLLETVRKARRYALKLARTFTAQDGADAITAWVEVAPRADGEEGCEIVLRNWQTAPMPPEDSQLLHRRRALLDRSLAELVARLDGAQRLLAVHAEADDLKDACTAMRAGIGRPWTDFVTFANNSHQQPMHWRLLDDAEIVVVGSDRRWRAHLFPQQAPGGEPTGFELCLTSEELPPARHTAIGDDMSPSVSEDRLVGRDVAPVLRQPIARIIANAETIRSRLAGPLAEEYSAYAADIAVAGQHLMELLDDLADLEAVESEGFSTAPDPIDLADVSRRASGILSMRAREKGITLIAPDTEERLPATAEFRRVLQILLNLVGNAIRYSPADSHIAMTLEESGGRGRVVVADQGPGLEESQKERVFEKFERLGRSGDGGSGLGLYISRRLARAMGGDLTVESVPGEGARFILDLPARDEASVPAA